MVLPKTDEPPEMEFEWKVPEKSNAIERDRARAYHEAYSAMIGLHCLEKALVEVRAGRTKSWRDFKVPTTPSASASTRRRAACCRTTW